MHELYKVARADTDKQLYLDFKPIADKIKLAKMQEMDNLTPLRRACRDGDCAAVEDIIGSAKRAQQAREKVAASTRPEVEPVLSLAEVDASFLVACTHGRVEVLKMSEMLPSAKRIGWKTVDYLIKETSRPCMDVLDYLLENRLDTRDLCVEKVKRRARVTTDDLWMIHKTRVAAHKAAKNVKHSKTKDQDEYVKDVHMSAVGQSQSNVLHVRGIVTELEEEEELDKLFSQYGTFVSATVRRKRTVATGDADDEEEYDVEEESSRAKSWALVTMGTQEDATNVRTQYSNQSISQHRAERMN
eukprot:COSAG05_NODE_260_length_12737_cov_4.788891_2_plen_301_part_00